MENQAGARVIVKGHAAHAANIGDRAGPLRRGIGHQLAGRKLEDEAFDIAAATGAWVPTSAISPEIRIIGRVSTTAYTIEAPCSAAARSNSTSDASVDAAAAGADG